MLFSACAEKSTGPSDKQDGSLLMIYMCGSDLESYYGFASKNLEEIASAVFEENNWVIVQTGGSKSWTDPSVSAYATNRIYFGSGGEKWFMKGLPSIWEAAIP